VTATTRSEHVIAFELRRGRFAHTQCIAFPYLNYKGETITRDDWNDATVAIPLADAVDLACVFCDAPLATRCVGDQSCGIGRKS